MSIALAQCLSYEFWMPSLFGPNTACCADLTGFFFSLFLRCRPMLEKKTVVATMRKPLILQDSSLRTWPFARPQGV
jgi:hypothetical protein